ncbi:type III-B CRISPR module RAMP protein Cmr6 [Bacteroidia bacterium]|nr:type III-B CRISPR module RAMP protein Cmr6 [Bacteroidia bacterium]
MGNLHKSYYKDYFNGVFRLEGNEVKRNKEEIIEKNKKLVETQLEPIDKISSVTHTFELKTLYPGLITGVGINHEVGIEGEFKLGVHFDYTYGMPVVYGSSVKGILSEYFEDFFKTKFPNLEEYANDFFNDIFEGKTRHDKIDENGKPVKGYDNKSIYNRDIFFDAVIVEAYKQQGKLDKILDSDTLCPHGTNPLKNPIPISFLKIASGVKMEFRFKLVDSEIGNKKLTADEKKTIFETILKTVGVGAKTNVGYGQFTDIKPEK